MSATTMSSFLRALRYEAHRMRTAASVRVLAVLALLGAALAALPAANALVGHPGGLAKASLADLAWTVGGGRPGAVLPGCAAAAAAAWFGACSIDYEYRHGTAVSLYASIPRRGAVLAAKVLLVAVFAALLELACAGLAFGATSLGFSMAGSSRPLPASAALATPAAVACAVACGVLSLLLATTVRIRLLAACASLALVTAAAACVAAPAASRAAGPAGPANPAAHTNPAAATFSADPADPLGAPAARIVDHLSSLAHLPAGWNSGSLLGPALLGALALVFAVAARGTIGRRRAQ